MIYDLSNPLHANSLLAKVEQDVERKKIVEYKEKQMTRTIAQNSYAHVAIGYFALQIGETLEYCKRRYFKYTCNPDIFVREKTDKITKDRVKELRSMTDLTKEELSTSIERFVRWAHDVAEIPIPPPEKTELVNRMRMEVENNRRFI